MSSKYRLALFASGSGTNAEEIFKYFQHHSSIEVTALLSGNAEAYALQRARNFSVDTFVFDRKQFRETTEVLAWLTEKDITHIVLAGFLWLIPDYLIQAFPHKIINIHPALLPKHGGKGMYGMKVHEAVRTANDSETGITIHAVNEHYDEGEVIFQASCPVDAGDTPEQIADKVHALEYAHYAAVIERWVLGYLRFLFTYNPLKNRRLGEVAEDSLNECIGYGEFALCQVDPCTVYRYHGGYGAIFFQEVVAQAPAGVVFGGFYQFHVQHNLVLQADLAFEDRFLAKQDGPDLQSFQFMRRKALFRKKRHTGHGAIVIVG
jgi:phosphoribosylglycinamide formyltransferase-1